MLMREANESILAHPLQDPARICRSDLSARVLAAAVRTPMTVLSVHHHVHQRTCEQEKEG